MLNQQPVNLDSVTPIISVGSRTSQHNARSYSQQGVEQWSYKTAAWQMQIAKEWDMAEKVLGRDAILETTVNQLRKVTADHSLPGQGEREKLTAATTTPTEPPCYPYYPVAMALDEHIEATTAANHGGNLRPSEVPLEQVWL